jgi:hypothetical protein
MALREGDDIVVRRQATVWLSQYDSFKPAVSLRRVLGSDPDADRDEMDRILYVELRRAVLMEVRDRAELDAALGYSTTKLIKHCEEVVRNGIEGQSARGGTPFPAREEEGRQERKKAKRKAVARKARRRST